MMKNSLLQKSAFLLTCMITILHVSPLLGADAPPMTFRGMSAIGDVGGIYFTNNKGEPEEFQTCDYMRSKFYRAAGGPELVFYKIIPAEKEGEKPKREVVGSVPWPDGTGPFLVLASKNGDKYDFSVATDDDASFPIGSSRLINASRLKVLVRVGDKTATLQPGASTVLKPSPPPNNQGMLFELATETIPDRLLFSTALSRTQMARTLVFVLNRPNPNHPIDVKLIQEDDKLLKSQRTKEAQEAKPAQR